MPPNAVQNPRRQKRQRIGLSLLSKRKKLTGPTKQSIFSAEAWIASLRSQ
jgi:hypothetical protein